MTKRAFMTIEEFEADHARRLATATTEELMLAGYLMAMSFEDQGERQSEVGLGPLYLRLAQGIMLDKTKFLGFMGGLH